MSSSTSWILLLANPVVLALLAWLVKRAIDAHLAKRLEDHKAELRQITERCSAELRVISHRYETMFTALHAKRVEAIQELYDLLLRSVTSVGIVLSALDLNCSRDVLKKTVEDNAGYALSSIHALMSRYRTARIYLSEPLIKRLEQIARGMEATNYQLIGTLTDLPEGSQELVDQLQQWRQHWISLRAVLDVALEDMTNEFRRLLGFSEDELKSEPREESE
ncbi:MAG: hypothetical protein KAY32_17470 [Candidatus Eisenbacteria sp.]|nr:hypothetical protein [Candidatus Eisenbacteria bacterium]